MSVHPSFLKMVQSVRPYLTVQKNPHPTSMWDQWWVCQPVKRLEEVYGIDVDGLFALNDYQYPVLAVPQVSQYDNRVIQALYEALWENQRSAKEIVLEHRARKMKEHLDHTEDWARGPGYWAFRKWVDQFNLGNIQSRDPSRDYKELQDKLGRDLNP